MKVVILHDDVRVAAGPDQIDALVQANAVSSALEELGSEFVSVAVSLDLKGLEKELRLLRPDLVFNLVESLEGKGRLIHFVPALLDSLRIPYTGSGTDAMYVTSNKMLAKKFMVGAGISVPTGFSLKDLELGGIRTREEYIIKSVWEHASIGIDQDAVVKGPAGMLLKEALGRIERLGGECFVEEFIQGREFNVSLLARKGGVEILPPAEIRFDDFPTDKPRLVGYRAKWEEGSFEYTHTPRSFEFPPSDEPLMRRLCDISLRCWRLFGLRGYARVDFRVGKDLGPKVLEINANPCLSPDAGFVAAAGKGGISFREVIGRILKDVKVKRG